MHLSSINKTAHNICQTTHFMNLSYRAEKDESNKISFALLAFFLQFLTEFTNLLEKWRKPRCIITKGSLILA